MALFAVTVLVFAASSNGNLYFDVVGQLLAFTPPQMFKLPPKVALSLETADKFAPAVVLAVFLLIFCRRVPVFRSRLSTWWRTGTDTKLLFLLIGVALWIVHFVAPNTFLEYQTPAYLPQIVILAAMAGPLTQGQNQSKRTLLLAACLVACSAPAWILSARDLWHPTNTLTSANKASEILAQRGMPGDTLLGGFNHLALASGLRIYPGNEMGLFSVADGSSPAETTSRHLLSKEAVTLALESCSSKFVAIFPYGLFPVSFPSNRDIAEGTQRQWIDLLRARYRMIYSDGEIRIFERITDTCGKSALSVD